MATQRVLRPVVRSFKSRFAGEAAQHVRAGGHAIVWESLVRARLVIPVPVKGDEMDLGYWSILDLAKSRYRRLPSGPMKGLATTLIPRDCFDIVRRRVERDSVHPHPTREIRFDCLACGACCRDNNVQLQEEDLERFSDGGRADLGAPPYTRRKGGAVVLTLRPDRACRHLGNDNRCGIYSLRPDACSTFPVGSECCLYAREEEFGWVDGAPAESDVPQ